MKSQISYICPKCLNAILTPFSCIHCDTTYPSAVINNTKIVDFLRATYPGKCYCSEDQRISFCNVNLAEVKEKTTTPIEFHHKSKILKQFRHFHDKFILDIGCREAPIGHLLATNNYMIGLDCCPQKMLIDNSNALNKGYKELLIADAYKIPIASEQIDLVIATDLLEHVVTPEYLIKEFFRVLKKDGKLLVSVPNLVSYNNRLSILFGSGLGMELHLLLKGRNPINPISGVRYPDQKQHLRFFTLKSLSKVLREMGFVIEQTKGYDPLLSRIPGADILLKNTCLLAVIVAKKQ